VTPGLRGPFGEGAELDRPDVRASYRDRGPCRNATHHTPIPRAMTTRTTMATGFFKVRAYAAVGLEGRKGAS
jgi:hypothetical protein